MCSMLKAKVILLVEDNPDDERLTIMGFRENHIFNEIIVARDGVEALDFFEGKNKFKDRDTSELPAIVILDLKIPKLDGVEVLRQIRANHATQYLPVVILTSSNAEKDIVQSYELGVNAYVQKPIDFNDFTEAVKHLGMFWLLLNQSPKNNTQLSYV